MQRELSSFDRIFNIIILGILLSFPVIVIEVLLYLELLDPKTFTVKYGIPVLAIILVFLLSGIIIFSHILKRLRKSNMELYEEVNKLKGINMGLEIKNKNLQEENRNKLQETENRWRVKFDEFRLNIEKDAREKLKYELSKQRELIEEEWNRIQKERIKTEKILSHSETIAELKNIKEKIDGIFGDIKEYKNLEIIDEDNYKILIKRMLNGVQDSILITNPVPEFYRYYLSYLEKISLDNKKIILCYKDIISLLDNEYIETILKMDVNLYYIESDMKLIIKDNFEMNIQCLDNGLSLFVKTDFSLRKLIDKFGMHRIFISDCILNEINCDNYYIIAQGIDKPIIYDVSDEDKINPLLKVVGYQPMIRLIVSLKDDVYRYFYHRLMKPQDKKKVNF
ncbi:MAG: hypothetical protein AB1765_05465 [Candidatus Hydrogenedentota bacterium]